MNETRFYLLHETYAFQEIVHKFTIYLFIYLDQMVIRYGERRSIFYRVDVKAITDTFLLLIYFNLEDFFISFVVFPLFRRNTVISKRTPGFNFPCC